MNMERLFDDAIELIQNRRRKSIESRSSHSDYSYGRTTAFNECLATLKDLKKGFLASEKKIKSEKVQTEYMPHIKKQIYVDTLQIV